MHQSMDTLEVDTSGKGLYDVTRGVRMFLSKETVRAGLLTVFCRHTSASLLIQENADPDVQTDLQRFFEAVAPEGARLRPRVRRAGRHARAHSGGAHSDAADDPGRRGPHGARHLAGHLPLRAPARAAPPLDRSSRHRRMIGRYQPCSKRRMRQASPAAAAGALGSRITRHCACASTRSMDESCSAWGTATGVPSSRSVSVARM